MAKNFQISYIINAVDRASKVFDDLERKSKRLSDKENKRYLRNQSQWAKEETRKHNVSLARQRLQEKRKSDSIKQAVRYRDQWAKEENRAFSIERSRNKIKQKEQAKLRKIETDARNQRIKDRNQWARDEDRRYRIEQARNRKREREQKAIRRQSAIDSRQRFTGYQHAGSMAGSLQRYVSLPATIGAGISLRNAMRLEQQQLSLTAFKGKEGGKEAYAQIAKYAIESALSIQDVQSLFLGLYAGKKHMGVEGTKEIMGKVKDIGDLMLSFVGDRARRAETAEQFRQIFMKGVAEMRFDLKIIQEKGIPIYGALEKYTGMGLEKLRQFFFEKTGSMHLPAKLIADIVSKYARDPNVIESLKIRSTTLTQAFDSLADTAFVWSGEIGLSIAKQSGLITLMDSVSSSLQKRVAAINLGKDWKGGPFESIIGLGTVLAISVPVLTGIMIFLKKIVASLAITTAGGQVVSGGRILLRNALMSTGIMSALYLTTVDWGNLIEDIGKNGLSGWINNLDIVAASTFAILGAWQLMPKAIKKAAGAALAFSAASSMGVMAKVGKMLGLGTVAALGGKALMATGGAIAATLSSPIVLGAAALGGVGYAGYKGYQYLKEKEEPRFRTIPFGLIPQPINYSTPVNMSQTPITIQNQVNVNGQQKLLDVNDYVPNNKGEVVNRKPIELNFDPTGEFGNSMAW